MKKLLLIIAATAIACMACKDNKKNDNQVTSNPEEVKTEADSAKVEEEESSKAMDMAGKKAPDFILKDLNDKDFKLSSLKGQYVVVDFWGTWCVWCLFGMPEMKKYYDKYEGKFQIVSIACGDELENWKKSVAELEMTWVNVINQDDSDKDVTKPYNVDGFPTKFIVNPKGVIEKVYIGEDPAFYEYLDKIFG